jgi:HK97 family phage portal protein
MSLFRRSEKRSQSITAAQLISLFEKQGVTAAGALERSIAVSRAAAVTAGAIGSLPLKSYRDASDGRREVASSLLSSPHRRLTPYEWKELIGVHLMTWGNAYLAIEPNAAGLPAFLDPLDPSRVTPKKVKPSDANTEGVLFAVTLDDGTQKDFTSKQILHIPGLGYDGLKGLGPVGVARKGIAGGLAAEEFAVRLWDSGALQGGILTTTGDLTEEQAKAVKQRWKDSVSGLDNAHDIAVLNGGLEFKPTTMSPEDSQFVESRKFQAEEIYRLFGLNEKGEIEAPSRWLRFTLLPYLRRVESRLSRLLPRGQFCEFVTEGLLRADIRDRYNAYGVALEHGWISVAEVRELENLPPRDGTDELRPLGPGSPTPNARIGTPGGDA